MSDPVVFQDDSHAEFCVWDTFVWSSLKNLTLVIFEKSINFKEIGRCDQKMLRQNVSSIILFDSRSLKTEGQEDIKFSLVGFGGLGELTKPHIFTSGSRIFNDKSKMTPALNNLKNNGKNGDVFEALQYAARLGFRPGVTKTFVLVMCDDVTNVLTSKAYGDRYGFT